nr:retrovirus-related Pol polyprotein from transposon TNT 1-94 [Tanacetum cinerariifolium]
VYFVEGLGHNLFSVGQFYDSNLEVAFRRNACFVRNLEGVDLLKGDRSTKLYTINLHEMASASPICLMARAYSTKSWLWHQRLSHLNFDTINDLARNDLVAGLPKFKYHKEHLCPSCDKEKAKEHLIHQSHTLTMSTQQDIYAAGFENRPPMLNKENYVPWSSRLLHYAKSRPNGKLIYNLIMNGPYIRRMIPELGDADREVPFMSKQTMNSLRRSLNRNNGNQIRCYNCRGLGHLAKNCTVRPRRRDASYLQTQLLIAQKEEARIQLQAKEFDLMAAIVDLDEIEEVNENCILMANFQQASTLVLGTGRFGNDHVAAILGYGDLQWGNILITKIYFVEGLGHNLFSVGQFCDSNLEVTFRRNICFIRNLEGVDLLKGNRTTNLYTINLHDIDSASPICLMACATFTKSWLWHQCLSHLSFDTINDLAKNDLVTRLPKFKYHKEHLCPLCEQGKSKRASHPPKPVPNSRQRLHLLHMDLCGPMRIASINGKRYILVIVDDYSRYSWVHFLRSKDEAPEVIIKFLKRITVLLQSPIIIIRTDNGIEFKNEALKVYFDSVGITHQMSSVRTPQQNRVVERRNRTLVEAARTMLIFSCASLFLWAKAIATACFTQNRSIIHR